MADTFTPPAADVAAASTSSAPAFTPPAADLIAAAHSAPAEPRLPFHSLGGGVYAPGPKPAQPFSPPAADTGAADVTERINTSTPEELAKDHTFDSAATVAQLHTALTPEQIKKLAKADFLQKQQGMTAADIGRGLAKTPGAVKDFVVGLNDLVNRVPAVIGQAGYNLGGGTTESASASPDEAIRTQAKESSEALAGLESGVTSFGGLVKNIWNLGKNAGPQSKVYDEAKATQDLFDRAGNIQQQGLVAQGQGEAAKAVGVDAESLAKQGVQLDPEVIQRLASVESPVNWIPILSGARIAKVANGTFSVLNKAGLPIATGLARNAAENTVAGIGKLLEKSGGAVSATASKAGLLSTGAVGHLLHAAGAPVSAAGLVAAKVGGAVAGKALTTAGKLAQNPAVYGPLIDFAGSSAKGAAGGLAFGAAMNLGAETPQETADNLTTAAGFGALGGALHEAGTKIDQAHLNAVQHTVGASFSTAPETQPVADYKLPNANPDLEAQHQAALSTLKAQSPLAANLLNRYRAAMSVRGTPSYLLTEEQAKALSPDLAGKDGASRVNLPTADGSSKSGIVWVVGKDGVPALGHEVGHFVDNNILTPDEKAALDKVTAGKWQEGFNKHYLGSEGLTDAQKQALTPEKLQGELRAEILSGVLNGADFSNVPQSIQKTALGVAARVLERLGMYEPGVTTPNSGAPNATAFGTKFSPVAHAIAREAATRFANTPIPAEVPVAAPAPAVAPAPVTPAHEQILKSMEGVMSTADHTTWTALKDKVAAGKPLTPDEARDWRVLDNASKVILPEVKAAPAAEAPKTEEIKPVVAPAPEVAPAPAAEEIKPAKPEVPNLRVTREQQNKFENTPERTDIGIQEASAALKDASPEQKAIFETLRESLRAPQGQVKPVEVVHGGVVPEEVAGGVRTKRRTEQESQNARGEFQKVLIPNGFNVTNEGKVQLRAFSPDKVIANAHQVVEDAAKKKVESLIPYEIKDGKLTSAGETALNSDLEQYLINQAAGFKGTGESLTRPEGHGGFIPPENNQGQVKPIASNKVDFLNLVQAIAPPKTARVNTIKGQPIKPVNVRAYELAKANAKEVTKPGAISNKDINKQTYGPEYGNQSIVEPNLLRKKLDEAGVPTRQLIEATERLNLEDIKQATPRPENRLRAPVTDVTAAGFLPKRVAALTPEEFSKEMTADKDGIRRAGIKYGLKLASDAAKGTDISAEKASIQALRDAAIAKSKEFMRAKDLTNAMAEGTRATWLREVVEAADNPTRYKKLESTENGVQFLPGQTKPIEEVETLAKDYAKSAGIKYNPPSGFAQYDRDLGKRLASFYDKAEHSPESPEVRKSYDAFSRETVAQFKAIEAAGYDLEPLLSVNSPYHSGADAMRDVDSNNHLFFNLTEAAFGPGGKDTSTNLLLKPTGVVLHGKEMNVNDLFRAVHDFFGHARRGVSFGPRGEFNAWREHSALYSPEAQGALAAETIGQTAWTQLGPHLLNGKGELIKPGEQGFTPRKDRPFADQKNFVMPRRLIDEANKAATDFQPKVEDFKDPDTIKDTLASPGWAILTATQESTGPATHEKNLSANRELAADLKSKGYKFVEAAGSYKGVDQGKNFIVTGITPDRAIELGKDYGQESVLVPDGLLYQDGTINPVNHANTIVGDEAAKQDFYSKVKDGPAFSMDIDFSQREPYVNHEGIQFQPSQHPRAIRAAAIEDEKGNRFEGPMHLSAYMEASKAGNEGPFKDGFVTNKGEFLDRTEAFHRAVEMKQYQSLMGETELESTSLAAQQRRREAGYDEGTNPLSQQFQPKKKTSAKNEDIKLDEFGRPPGYWDRYNKPETAKEALAPKLWMYPNEEVHEAGTNTHEEHLAENAKSLNEKFKANFSETADQGERLKALNKGFVRMAYENNGRLNIEANADKFTKGKRDKLFEFISDNLSHIDKVSVGLLNQKGETVKSDTRSLLNMTDEEKLNNIPFISDFADVGGAKFLGSSDYLPRRHPGEPPVDNYNRAALNEMGKAAKAKHFPEAIVGVKGFIPSDLTNSPRYKEAAHSWQAERDNLTPHQAAVESFGDELVKKYRDNEHLPEVQEGSRWYSDVAPAFQKFFGADAPLFAELVAATSPRNPPKQNWDMALEAYKLYKAGWYQEHIAKFEEGLAKAKDGSMLKEYDRDVPKANQPVKVTSATLMNYWIDKHDLSPRKSPRLERGKVVEKLYSMHSDAVLQVLARRWLEKSGGPKTLNFVQNLVGSGHGATIDLWADRTLREAGYKGYVDRWRIRPENVSGVSNKDFAFGQEVFKNAADKLGMNADDLQGALWFAEKLNWAEKGWSPLDLGTYKPEAEKLNTASVPELISRVPATRAEAREKVANSNIKLRQQNLLDIRPVKK